MSITAAAFEAVSAMLPGSVAFERDPGDNGERLIWLEPHILDKLRALRAPGENYGGRKCGRACPSRGCAAPAVVMEILSECR